MSTVIVKRDGQGHIIGSCDAKCYDASHPECHCICGGANHGQGKKQAIKNNRKFLKKKFPDLDFIPVNEELF